MGLLFSLAFIGGSKQGYSFGGALEEATNMIIYDKSVPVPTLEKYMYIWMSSLC